MSKANFRAMQADGFGPLLTKGTTAGSTSGNTLTASEIANGGIIVCETGTSVITICLPVVTSKMERKPVFILNSGGTNAVNVIAMAGASYWGGGVGADTSQDTMQVIDGGMMGIVMAVDGRWYGLAGATDSIH